MRKLADFLFVLSSAISFLREAAFFYCLFPFLCSFAFFLNTEKIPLKNSGHPSICGCFLLPLYSF